MGGLSHFFAPVPCGARLSPRNPTPECRAFDLVRPFSVADVSDQFALAARAARDGTHHPSSASTVRAVMRLRFMAPDKHRVRADTPRSHLLGARPREAFLTAAQSLTFPVASRTPRPSSHFHVFLVRDLRRAPPLGVRLTLAPFRQERARIPLFKGQTPFRSETTLRRSSVPRGVSPRGVATRSPWPGFTHSSRTRFTPRIPSCRPRSRQRARGPVPVLAHSVPKDTLRCLWRVNRRARRADFCSPLPRFSKTSIRVSLATG
jgi:hypothetical protein